jgi:hypothetical protein
MAKSTGGARGESRTWNVPSYSSSDIARMEKLTIEKANKAISATENAMAMWEASLQKPEDVGMRVGRLKYFYDQITVWERKMLKSMAKKEDMVTRIKLLREFSDICHSCA